MIRIQSASGQTLQLNDTSIEFELNNWLLADSEDLPGSYSYPVSFPLTEQNKKFLQHSHLPESRPRDIPVTIWVNGIVLRKSSLSYKIQKSAASGYLKVDAGELASKVKGVYLYEVLEGEKVYLYDAFTNPDPTPATQKQDIVQERMLAMAKAEPGEYPITFFPVLNYKFQPETLKDNDKYKFNQVVNGWAKDKFLVDSNMKYGRPIVPFLYFTYMLKRICTFFGYTAKGSFINDPEINTWVIYNTQALQSPNIITREGLFADLRLHVPYMTISDFFKALRDDLGLSIVFDSTNMQVTFELYKTIIESSTQVTDLSAFTLAGYENDMPDEKGFAIISYEDSNDLLLKNADPITTKIKKSQKDVKANIGFLTMSRTFNPDSVQQTWLIPRAEQSGNLPSRIFYDESEYYSVSYNHKNEFGLRLLSYHGMQPSSNGLYPYATSLSSNYEQKKIGNLSFDPTQNDSIYKQLTIPFYQFLANAKRLSYEMLIPLSKAKDIQLTSVYSIKGENQVRIKFLVEQFTFSAPGKHGFLPGKLMVYVITNPEPTPNLYSGEIFYVEMIMGNEWTSYIEERQVSYADFTIKVWADLAKTVPANPTNLEVRYVASIYADQVVTDDFYTISVSGHEYFLPALITADSSQQSQILYGVDYSDNYTVV